MAFKIPKPTYDAKVVAAIEEFLDQDRLTKIEHTQEQDGEGIEYTFALGRGQKSNPRPMFQIIPRDAFSCMTGSPRTPCQCDRFDRSWNCDLHPEISWDAERRRWNRPCTGDRTSCECIPCRERREIEAAERSSGYTDMGTDGLRPPQGLIDAYNELHRRSQRCTCRWCQPQQADGRRFFPVETQEAERRRQYELEHRRRIQGDGQPIDWSAFERVPTNLTFNLTGTFDARLLDRIFPADYRQPFTLEIESETEQGAGPLAIEVEPDSDATA